MPEIYVGTDWHLDKDTFTKYNRTEITFDGESVDNIADRLGVDDTFVYLGDLYNDPYDKDNSKSIDNLSSILKSISSHKVFCKGNHDIADNEFYHNLGFDVICDICICNSIIFSHRPVDNIPMDMINIHGHLHDEKDVTPNSYQYVNAYTPNTETGIVSVSELLRYAIEHNKDEYKDQKKVASDNSPKYTTDDKELIIHNISDRMDYSKVTKPLTEAINIYLVKELEEITTPEKLLEWVKKNIQPVNLGNKLSNETSIVDNKKASSHDYVMFCYNRLHKMDLNPKILFIAGFTDDKKSMGWCHSLIYWENDNKNITWFEPSLKGYVGLNKYDNYNALKDALDGIYKQEQDVAKYPQLVIKKTSISKYKEDKPTKEFIKDILSSDKEINESMCFINSAEALNEILFDDPSDTEAFMQDDDYYEHIEESAIDKYDPDHKLGKLNDMDKDEANRIAAKYDLHLPGHTPEEIYEKTPEYRREQERKRREKEKELAKKMKLKEEAKKEKERRKKGFIFAKKDKSSTNESIIYESDICVEDPADYTPDPDMTIFGPAVRLFNTFNEYNKTVSESYKFEIEDKSVKFFDDVLSEEANSNNKLYPVYILLQHSGTLLANIIKKVTKSHFSHSSISFDSSLTHMYSFGRKRGTNPFIGAFTLENINDKFFKERTIPFALYVVPCTKDQIDRMKKRLDYFIKNSTKFKYDFTGLMKNYLGIVDNPEYRWFCSRFVADIINAGAPSNKPYVIEPSLMRPEDFINTNFATYVIGGYLNMYDSTLVDRITNRILRSEELKRARQNTVKGTNSDEIIESIVYNIDPFDPLQKDVLSYQLSMMDESVIKDFTNYLSSFNIRFDKKGNVIITRKEYDKLDTHLRSSIANIKAYRKANNMEGLKFELAKIHYMISLINNHFLNAKSLKTIDPDIKKKMLDMRSVMLNTFQQNLKILTEHDKKFDFNKYYENSKYGSKFTIPSSTLMSIGKVITTKL